MTQTISSFSSNPTENFVDIYASRLTRTGNTPPQSVDPGTSFFPIVFCVCVHDSPNSPCICTDTIVWISRSAVIDSEVVNQRSEDGYIIERLELRPEDGLLIPAPEETTRESEIRWYQPRINKLAKSVTIMAFNNEGAEISRHTTIRTRRNKLSFAVTQRNERVMGEVEFLVGQGRVVRVQGNINDERFTASRQLTSTSAEAEIQSSDRLTRPQVQLLTEWSRIFQPLIALKSAIDNNQGGRSSDWGCFFLSAGTATLLACCAVGNDPCCGAGLIGLGEVIDRC